jgi:predicted AAA+ superfamily ATPase
MRESGTIHCMARVYLRRLVDDLIKALLSELPALLLTGPRGTGKTTTAMRYARTVVRLDREAEAVAFRADPDAALRGLDEPVLLDEWQAVPAVLGAVKRAVDADPHPGRYLITGSARADLDAQTWPGTGRFVRVPMFGLTVRELEGGLRSGPFLDAVAARRADVFEVPATTPDLRDYVELALRGGFPEPALHLSADARARWIDSYVDQMLTRDAAQIDGGRDPERLRRYFEVLALNTAGVVDEKTLYDSAGINRKTAIAYEQLLRNLLIVEGVPAWTSNRLKRLVRSPKRYVVDPALVAGILRLDAAAVLRDGDLLGRLLDTFVAAQLRAELPVCSSRPRIFHLRQEQGRHEIDVVAELGAHEVIALEVKADAAPGPDAAKHLRWLRDELGDRFLAGVVLHTGPRSWQVGDRIVAAPICTLWG